MNLFDAVLNFLAPKQSLISGNLLPESESLNYLNDTELKEILSKYSSEDILNSYITHFDKDDLSIFKFYSLFTRCDDSSDIMNLIYYFKYNGIKQIGNELGNLLADRIDEYYDYVIPLPIHKIKKRERGFNQSDIIANSISKHKNFTFLNNAIERSNYSISQTKLTAKERTFNLKNGFKKGINYEKVYGKKILLVDDVLTTGTTLNEAATTLLNIGAKRVDAAVLVSAAPTV